MCHNEKLRSVYRPPNTVRLMKSMRLRWTEHIARMREGRSTFKILTSKPTRNRSLGRSRRRQEGNVRMDNTEIQGMGIKSWQLFFFFGKNDRT